MILVAKKNKTSSCANNESRICPRIPTSVEINGNYSVNKKNNKKY